jgi:hypothetical protein
MKIHGTAKGAALSTKDFGVAFSGNGAVSQICFADGTTNDYVGASRTSVGTQIGTAGTNEWLDKTTLNVTVYLKRANTNSGNITMIQTNAGGTIATSDTVLDSATLTTSYVTYTFTFGSAITISADTYIGIFRAYGGAGQIDVQIWPCSEGGGCMTDATIMQGFDDPNYGSGSLNWCIDG